MSKSTIINIEDIPVMCVRVENYQRIPVQAERAFKGLESRLPTLWGRKFYGVEQEGVYRACVAMNEGDDPSALGLESWTIPGGKYANKKIKNWMQNIHRIGPTFEAIEAENDMDPSRPSIEYYRSQKELILMLPVK